MSLFFAPPQPPAERALWLDLGNTRLKYWLTEHGQVLQHGAELHLQSPLDLLRGLRSSFAGWSPQRIILSSVLDAGHNQQVLQLLAGVAPRVEQVRVEAHHPQLATRYDASRLGVDRWLQVLAVAPAHPQACVVGCGTALTIDLLDAGVHQGGYILPSLYLQREALNQGTRQIRIQQGALTSLAAGTHTQEAVLHGILLGLVGAIEKTLQDQPERPLFLTGGDAPLLAGFLSLPNPRLIVPDLLLAGLYRYCSGGHRQG